MSTVFAGPTKRFFVTMLTRDIALNDAILDLLDNCIDGILRQRKSEGKKKKSLKPYRGYRAAITANPNFFCIEDNCGGIPRDIAERSAFMLGRPETDRDEDLETVGMYGIGMKRAIFKLGSDCSVTSQPSNAAERFRVDISPDWLEDEKNWKLELIGGRSVEKRDSAGTTIKVKALHPEIGHQFNSERSSFLEDLHEEIANFYALILDKGFSVELNGVKVAPIKHQILMPRSIKKGPSIAPYMYQGVIDDVTVELVVGFHRALATEFELDQETVQPRSQDDAGWTVICNDRVVLHRDKSMLTGWGRASVPRYHNQFISIAGVVVFRSNKSLKLPLNTTKRGLDSSSLVYLTVLDLMTEGLKKFTSFTNAWKGREEDTNEAFRASEPQLVTEAVDSLPEGAWSQARKHGGKKFSPNLPKPKPTSSRRRISFQRSVDEIRRVSRYLFDGDAEVAAKEVGEKCFDSSLAQAKKAKKK